MVDIFLHLHKMILHATSTRSSAPTTPRIPLPFLYSISSILSLVACLVALSCIAFGVRSENAPTQINEHYDGRGMQEELMNVRGDLGARLDAVHRNEIDCNTCVRVSEFLHAELVEMEHETDVDSIETEEELAKHHAKELKTRKRKLLHGRSEPKIRDTVLHSCIKCADYDHTKTYYLQDYDCDACHVILFGSQERERVLLEGRDDVEEDERRLDHVFHTLVDHTFELGTPDLKEMVDFICVPHYCRAEEAEHHFSGELKTRHEEL